MGLTHRVSACDKQLRVSIVGCTGGKGCIGNWQWMVLSLLLCFDKHTRGIVNIPRESQLKVDEMVVAYISHNMALGPGTLGLGLGPWRFKLLLVVR